MVRLVAFLLVIGLALYTVARIMAVFRNDPKQLPGPDEVKTDESADSTRDASDDDEPPPS